MKRLIAVIAVALTMTFVAACEPDDGTGTSPGIEEPGLGSPSLESPGLESMAPEVSPAS